MHVHVHAEITEKTALLTRDSWREHKFDNKSECQIGHLIKIM